MARVGNDNFLFQQIRGELTEPDKIVGLVANSENRIPIYLDVGEEETINVLCDEPDIKIDILYAADAPWTYELIVTTKEATGIFSVALEIGKVKYAFYAVVCITADEANKIRTLDFTKTSPPSILLHFDTEKELSIPSSQIYFQENTDKITDSQRSGYSPNALLYRGYIQSSTKCFRLDVLKEQAADVVYTEYYGVTYRLLSSFSKTVQYAASNKVSAKMTANRCTIVLEIPSEVDYDCYNLTKGTSSGLVVDKIAEGFCAFWDRNEKAAYYTVEILRAAQKRHIKGKYPLKKVIVYQGNAVYTLNEKEQVYSISNVNPETVSVSLQDLRFMISETIERNKCFYSINGLPKGLYLIQVKAENRNGELLWKSYLEHVWIYKVVI